MAKINFVNGTIHFVKSVINRKNTIKNAEISKDPDKGDIDGVFRLHPGYLPVTVSKTEWLNENSKAIYFTGDLPYFRPGQYISVSVKIGNVTTARPYSIASSPKDPYYRIIVKKCEGGFVSEYLMNEVKEKDTLEISEPSGEFTYSPLRDKKHIVALAGGSGITPFISMAEAIRDKVLDIRLTILYGTKTVSDDIFPEELKNIGNVEFVNVLSEEEKEGCLHGFLTRELVSKYTDENTSVFICGPEGMYHYLEKEIEGLLPKRLLRYEIPGSIKNILKLGYPEENKENVYQITVRQGMEEKTISAKATDSLMVSLEKAGLAVPNKCRSGACGFCHSKAISGECFVPEGIAGRRFATKEYGFIHPCITYPVSDMTIEVPAVLKEAYYDKK